MFQPNVLGAIFKNFPQSSAYRIHVTDACLQDGFCNLKGALCGFFSHRCDGPAEGAAFGLPGLRGSYTTCPAQQQASQPGTHLQALEMEEKEKREAEALDR